MRLRVPSVVILGMVLIAMPGIAFSEAYKVTLSKVEPNTYKTFSGLKVLTHNCSANLFQNSVVIVIDEFGLEDSFYSSSGASCTIEAITLEHWTGRQALQSTEQLPIYTISKELNTEHIIINHKTYSTDFFCKSWGQGDRVVLFDTFDYVGCNALTGINLSTAEMCELTCE